jgi:hypothetical protein
MGKMEKVEGRGQSAGTSGGTSKTRKNPRKEQWERSNLL